MKVVMTMGNRLFKLIIHDSDQLWNHIITEIAMGVFDVYEKDGETDHEKHKRESAGSADSGA